MYQETSAEAFANSRKREPDRIKQILSYIASAGDATADEVTAGLGMVANQIAPGMTVLARRGVIVYTGDKRMTRLGSRARVFALAGRDN